MTIIQNSSTLQVVKQHETIAYLSIKFALLVMASNGSK